MTCLAPNPGRTQDVNSAEELLQARKMQMESQQALQLQGDPALQEAMANLKPFLESKFALNAAKLIQNPKFTKSLGEITQHPRRKNLLYAMGGWIIFMMLFRAWRLSIPSHWAMKIWTRMWTLGIFMAGASLVIPIAVFGEPYLSILRTISGLIRN